MERKLNGMSIRSKLLLFSICISLIPIAVITTFYYLNARHTLIQRTFSWLTAVADARRAHVLSALDAKRKWTIEASHDGHLEIFLTTTSRGGSVPEDTLTHINEHFLLSMQLDKHLIEMRLVDGHGTVVSSTSKALIGRRMTDQKLCVQTLTSDHTEACVCHPQFIPHLDAYCMFISSSIIHTKGKVVAGALVSTYHIDILNEITTNRVWMGETGEVYIVNKDGLMITESRFVENAPFKQVVDTKPIRKVAEGEGAMKGIYPDYRGVPIVGVSAYIPEYGWTLLAEIDKAEAFAPIRTLGIIALVIGLCSAVAVTCGGIIFAISTSRPLNKLKSATERLAAGDLTYRVDVDCGDEIGKLAHSFNAMIDALGVEIAERRQAEEALQEREKYFRTLTKLSPVGIFQTDTEGNCLYVNEQWCKIAGITPGEARGDGWTQAIHHNDRERIHAEWLRAAKENIPFSAEYRFQSPDGVTTWVFGQALAEEDANGEAHGYVGSITDITQQKQTEETIKTERQKLFRLLDRIPAFVYLQAKDYSIHFANSYFREHFGEPEKGILCYQVFHKRNEPCEVCPTFRVFDTNAPEFWEWPDAPDGRTYQIYDYPFTDTDGTPLVFELGIDITDRKKAEEGVKESEQRFRELAENIHEVFWMETADGSELLYTSPAYEQIWGRTCQSFYDDPQSWIDSIHPEDREHVEYRWSQWQARGKYEEEYRIVRPNGEVRWIHDRGFPIRDKSGEVYRIAGIAEDITERKKIEMALKVVMEEKDENIDDLKGLMDFSNLMRDETREENLIKHATHVLKERFNPDVIAVLMLDKDKNLLVMSGMYPDMPMDKVFSPEVSLDPSICYTVRTGKEFVVKDANKDLLCDCLRYEIGNGGYMCIPLVAGGATMGSVLMIKKKKGYWNSGHNRELFSAYVGLMATAINSVRLMENARRSAVTDSLTGISNRRFFDEMLVKQMALASRRNEPLSLLIIDLDHFKDFNDTYGHTVGDLVLQQMASAMKSSIRTSDILTRYGGEEFAIIMPTTDLANAIEKAEDIRRHVESNKFENIVLGKTFNMTISIGVATSPEHGEGPETLVDAADKALYKAKEGGRNRVETP